MTYYTPFPHIPEFVAMVPEKRKTYPERPVVKRKVKFYGRPMSEVRSLYNRLGIELTK